MKKMMALFIVLMPITLYYDIGNLEIRLNTAINMLLAICAVFMILKEKRYLSKPVGFYLLFVLWHLFSSVFHALYAEYEVSLSIVTYLYSISIAIIIFSSFYDLIDYEFFMKAYKVTGSIVLMFLFVQIISFHLFGHVIRGMLPFLPITESYGGEGAWRYGVYLVSEGSQYNAFSSLFSEGSHFSLYMVPLLCIVMPLKENNSFRGYTLPALITVGILLVNSGNGLICCLIIWVSHMLLKSNLSISKKMFGLVFIGLICLSVYTILSRNSNYDAMLGRLFVIEDSSKYATAKADYRIYRGFDLYSQLPIINKIFGVGYKALTSSANYFGITSIYDKSNIQAFEYLNTIAQILIYSGAVGFLLFFAFVKNLFKTLQANGKIILITFLALCFSSSIYYDAIWEFTLVLIVYYSSARRGSASKLEQVPTQLKADASHRNIR